MNYRDPNLLARRGLLHPSTLPALALVGAALAPGAIAQSLHADGPAIGTHVFCLTDALTVDSGGVNLRASETLRKKAGFDALQRVTTVTPGMPPRPSFKPDDLFEGPVHAALEIDAVSIGLDVIAADSAGRAIVPPNRWNAIAFSVGRGTVGAPGSRVQADAARIDGAAADVFTYTLPGSNLPPDLVAKVHRALDGTELGLAGPSTARTPGDLQALDLYIPLYELDGPIRQRLPGSSPVRPLTFYFSVSNAALAAGAVPAAWFGTTTPSGATILGTRWNGVRWLTPQPFLDYSSLGLLSTDDVDAFAYDGNCRALFSTVGAPRAQQVRFANLCPSAMVGGAVVTDYELPTGAKVGDQLGIGEGEEIEAICTIDPGRTLGDQNALVHGSYRNLGLPFPVTLDAQMYRGCTPGGLPALISAMAGWPFEPPLSGAAHFLISIDNGASWLVAGSFVRDPAHPLGDPIDAWVQLPMGGTILGVRVLGIWAAIDSGGHLGVSYPMELFV